MRDVRDQGRFEAGEGADTVFARYRLAPGRLIIDHVEAPPHLRGTGAAGALMEEIVDLARDRDLTIVPICGWAAHWLERRGRASA